MAKPNPVDWNDRLHVLLPKGAKDGLRAELRKRFGQDVPLNVYLKTLIEFDLMGKVEWGADVGNFPLLREMAKAEKK